jgi:hypothetical protein
MEYSATSDPTYFSSPDHPEEYPNSVESCVTTIYAAEGQVIQLDFESFELEASSSCGYDYLEV